MTPEEYQQFTERQAAARAEEQARRQAGQDETARLVAARKNGNVYDPKTQPSFDSYYAEKRAQEIQEKQAAELARLQALNPFDVWLSTLPYQERLQVQKWEQANPGLSFPLPEGFTVRLKSK